MCWHLFHGDKWMELQLSSGERSAASGTNRSWTIPRVTQFPNFLHLYLHQSLTLQTSLSCWMISLLNGMFNPRSWMSCCTFSLTVSVLWSALLWLGLQDLVWPIHDWRCHSIVLLHSYDFLSSYSLTFEITRGYTIPIAYLSWWRWNPSMLSLSFS